ncbi:hypothetical protein [Nocardia cyriacigeorgica]|uniref:hypothetical protein n=1 Tax=Nocardia cyriacigeorgica TaxID=135487 RepID=UPI0024554933|nr:hypothetical protein [Nocardia cyriacigeorgica]
MAAKTNNTDPVDEIFEAVLHVLMWLMGAIAVLAWWALLFPMISIPAGLAIAAGLVFGWPAGTAVAGVSIATLIGWRIKHKRSFDRWVTRRARARMLAWWRYRAAWTRKVTACGLSVKDGDVVRIPRIVSTQIGDHSDRVRVRMVEGQCPDDYDNRTDRLTHAFGAMDCHTRLTGSGYIELVFRRSDSLAETVAVPRVDYWTKKAA